MARKGERLQKVTTRKTSVRMIEPAGFAESFEIATVLSLSTDIT
jgi:hypothetical protein